MNRYVKRGFEIALILTIGAAGTLIVQRVRAAGIPASGALTYSGVLTGPDGVPVNGSKAVALAVFDQKENGTLVCQVLSTPTPVNAGHFQLPLPDACTTAVKTHPELWVDVQVDGVSLLGRTRLGAVPYAVEAASAANASGALDSRISNLEQRLSNISVQSTGYINCQPLLSLRKEGYKNEVIRASLFSDSGCKTPVNDVGSCHPFCAAAAFREGKGNSLCCGVGEYFTNGVVDVLTF